MGKNIKQKPLVLSIRTGLMQLAVAGSLFTSTQPSSAFPDIFQLSELDGTNGFAINGIAEGDGSGRAVGFAGDINGDGTDDIIISAPWADTGTTNTGQSYVLFGRAGTFSASIELSDLDGSNGFSINGIAAESRTGFSASRAGDVNGDGISDLIIGAYRVDSNGDNSGQSYVVFGHTGSFSSHIELSDLNGNNGFIINAVSAGDFAGVSVNTAGDVNNDGIADLIIGAPAADPNGSSSGQAYLVFGQSNGFSGILELSDLDGANGFVLNGGLEGDFAGRSVSLAGDINNDAIDDWLIGAPSASAGSGQTYLIFGNSIGFDNPLPLDAFDGTNGVNLNGFNVGASIGTAVSGAGDVNGDGIDDVITSGRVGNFGFYRSGISYVVFGRSNGFPANVELIQLSASDGFEILGGETTDYSSMFSLAAAGDVNSDGLDDLLIGARYATPNGDNSGESYVIFGNSDSFPSRLEVSDLNGTNGFAIRSISAGDQSGVAVSSAGDFNDDGINDLLIGSHLADPNGSASGQSYVIFGQPEILFSNGFEN